jgi:tripartite-type tricarboxylate transporter receptor subunit TctC
MPRLLHLLALCFVVASACAQEWPSKPVRIIVPFPPGGAADALPRIVAEHLAVKAGQPFIIENRPGATGSIGTDAVYRAEPDGYTLLSTPPAPLVINPSLYTKLPYDPQRLVPVAVLGAIPSVMLVNPSVSAGTVAEFVSLARQNPGKLNYASQGTTSVSFLTTEYFLAVAGGLRVTHVPYKGTAPGLAALLAGEVDLMFDNLGTSLQQVKAGRLKALAVCGEKRVASLPEVPAMNELYPGFVSVAWFGVLAPPKTPAALAERIHSWIAEALAQPQVQARLAQLSAEPLAMGPAEMARFMKEDAERWRRAIRAAGLKPGDA